eukprot:jgi/Mesen1/3445/ME000194S02591
MMVFGVLCFIAMTASCGRASDGAIGSSLGKGAQQAAETLVGRRIPGVLTGEDILRNAISLANALRDSSASASITPTPTYSLILKKDVKLTKCVIDGQSTYPVFVIENNYPAGLHLTNLRFQYVNGGVVSGYALLYARSSDFYNNYNYAAPGAVFSLIKGTVSVFPGIRYPLHVTGCKFVDNIARGSGGAIHVSGDNSAQTYVHITKSSFRNNVAQRGSGGAVDAGGRGFYCNQCTFSGNYAKTGGGAVSYTGFNNLTVINSAFLNNTSFEDKGGAVRLAVTGATDKTKSLFCSTTWVKNHVASAPKMSADLFLTKGKPAVAWTFTTARVDFCGFSKPPSTRLLKSTGGENVYYLGNSCVGCKGCPQECNGKGTCTLDADLIPSCACNFNGDPATYCADCKAGSLASKKCEGCEPGYLPQALAGGCKPCAGLAPMIADPYLSFNIPTTWAHYTTAQSAADCRNKCTAFHRPTTSTANYCNFWAYFGGGAEAGCPKSCLLAYNTNTCFNQTMNHNLDTDLFFQYNEPGAECPIL